MSWRMIEYLNLPSLLATDYGLNLLLEEIDSLPAFL
jgi:hypothetical protein